MYKDSSRFIVVIFFVAIFACPLTVFAQSNEVEFDNQSGQLALVKLIGPTQREVNVPVNSKLSVTALPGEYYIMVRYGTSENYQYTKGEKFEVTETKTKRSIITITLHKVIGGNYAAKPISANEFTASLTEAENDKEESKNISTSGGGQDISYIPADSTSQTWKFIKSEILPDFNGHQPRLGKKILKLYFDSDGYMLKMSFEDQKGEKLPLFATEMTSKHAAAIIEIDKSTTTVKYTLSKNRSPF